MSHDKQLAILTLQTNHPTTLGRLLGELVSRSIDRSLNGKQNPLGLNRRLHPGDTLTLAVNLHQQLLPAEPPEPSDV